ncbi:mariner Mos1 transposase [Trichonephila clavipes]|nr:mariner Mos1 transposase [Trichonephila clavipes]
MDKVIKVGTTRANRSSTGKPKTRVRNVACRKSYLHRIVTGDEKWIYFENPKRNRSHVDPEKPSKSSARPNRFGRKTMLCIFWDQEGPIYYMSFSNPAKPLILIPTSKNLNDAMLEKREQFKKRQHKVIFLKDNAPKRAKPKESNLGLIIGWPQETYLFFGMVFTNCPKAMCS